jgi:hypothetical protein
MMTMVRSYTATSILIAATLILLVFGLYGDARNAIIQDELTAKSYGQLADVIPTINDWGIQGRPNQSEPFTAWANVTDDDGDLANVSVHVIGPNMTLHQLMSFNSSLYVTDLDALTEVGVYDLYVTATDLANNTRYGRHLHVEIEPEYTGPPDPGIIMPYVVSLSLSAGVLVLIVAYLYGQKYRERMS